MTANHARCVVECGNVLGEGPLWCTREQVLWWIDISSPALWRYEPRSRQVAQWPLPKPPGSFALRERGGFLFAFRNGFATLDAPGAELEWFTPEALELADERFNDGKTDRRGRFWAGTLDRKLTRTIGKLYRLEPGLRVAAMDSGFTIANGIGWSPDDRTLYFTDTPSRRIYRYDFDAANGAIANRRVFVEAEPGHGGPDGLTVDADAGLREQPHLAAQFDGQARGYLAREACEGQSPRLPS